MEHHDNRGEVDPDLHAIRKMMEAQPRRTPRAVRELAMTPEERAAQEVTEAPPPPDSQGKELALLVLHKTQAFLARPDAPRLLAIALLAVIFVLRPLAVLGMALVALMVALITYFSLGPDRVGEIVVARYQRLKSRDPARAEVLRKRAARTSARLSRLLDHLPERWTQGLYLPDFEEPAEQPAQMHNDPFDRLVAQSELR